jgi:hypothetical protein
VDDPIEETLKACRDFAEEMFGETPYAPDIGNLIARIDEAIAARKLEKGLTD